MTRRSESSAALLRDRNFTAYFLSFLLSNVGLFMQSLGVPILLFALTRSSLWVGAGTFTAQIAALSMTPVSGILADRVNRRLLLLFSQAVQLGSASGLWWLAAQGSLTKWNMLAVLAVGGCGAGLQYSVAQAILPDLVAPAQLGGGIRLMTLAFNVPRAFGPLVAGVVVERWGSKATFAVNAASFVPYIVVLALVRLRPADRAPATGRWSRQFTDGLHAVLANPRLRAAVRIMFVTSLLGQAVFMHTADIGRGVYRVDGYGVGWLAGAMGLGAILASISLLQWAERRSSFLLGIIGMAVNATGALLVVAHRSFALGLPSFAVVGLGNTMVMISLSTLVQTECADEMRGRVMSIALMGILVGAPVGALTTGWFADRFGLRWVMSVVGVCLWAYAVRVYLRYREAVAVRRNEAALAV